MEPHYPIAIPEKREEGLEDEMKFLSGPMTMITGNPLLDNEQKNVKNNNEI